MVGIYCVFLYETNEIMLYEVLVRPENDFYQCIYIVRKWKIQKHG